MCGNAITLDAFNRCQIPREAWTHRAHLTIAYLLCRAYPSDGPDGAIERARLGIQKSNAALGIEQTETGGYHDTMTIAWMRVMLAAMRHHGPGDGPDQFLDQNPHLLARTLLRLYYSKERIMSREARHGWVEPDLAPLPK